MGSCLKCGKSEPEVKFRESRSKCTDCRNKDRMIWYWNNLERSKSLNSKYAKKRRIMDKLLIIDHYSNGLMLCSCCSENEVCFLTLDHINGGGGKHRRVTPNLYRNLVIQGFPEGYAILCLNCNMGRYLNGGICPHKNPSTIAIDATAEKEPAPTIKLTVNGVTRSVREWAQLRDISPFVIYSRIKQGVSPEEVINPNARLRQGTKPCLVGCRCKRHSWRKLRKSL